MCYGYNVNAACIWTTILKSKMDINYRLRVFCTLPFGKIKNRPHVFMNEQAQAALGEFQA